MADISEILRKLRSKGTLTDQEMRGLQTHIDELETSRLAGTHSHFTDSTPHHTHHTHTSVMLAPEGEEEGLKE
jgi:hypothetical protein